MILAWLHIDFSRPKVNIIRPKLAMEKHRLALKSFEQIANSSILHNKAPEGT